MRFLKFLIQKINAFKSQLFQHRFNLEKRLHPSPPSILATHLNTPQKPSSHIPKQTNGDGISSATLLNQKTPNFK